MRSHIASYIEYLAANVIMVLLIHCYLMKIKLHWQALIRYIEYLEQAYFWATL